MLSTLQGDISVSGVIGLFRTIEGMLLLVAITNILSKTIKIIGPRVD